LVFDGDKLKVDKLPKEKVNMETTLYTLGSVVIVSLVSFVGILIIFLQQERLAKTIAFLVPLAVGALLGDAFFHLIPESFEGVEEPATVSLLIILGIVSFFFLEKFLRWHHHSADISPKDAKDGDKKHLGNLIVVSDGFHNFIDGVIIGASYLVSVEVGIATTIAIILHEIPQEIGDFGVLLYAGYKKTTALFYNFLSALTAIAGAILVIILGSLPEQVTAGVIPFAAGIFIYIASSDLVPELHRNGKSKNLLPDVLGIGLGLLAMYALLFLE
jgi:zinc and cadmium transporter